jgi:hypothetical protein
LSVVPRKSVAAFVPRCLRIPAHAGGERLGLHCLALGQRHEGAARIAHLDLQPELVARLERRLQFHAGC